jgi:signal transduction histidine kinase
MWFCHSSRGQNYYIQKRNFEKKEGLASSFVNTVCQDTLGIIWVGTNYGLNRFDGEDFQSYYPNFDGEDGFSNVKHVLVDSKNNIWCFYYFNKLRIDYQSYLSYYDGIRIQIFLNEKRKFVSVEEYLGGPIPFLTRDILSYYQKDSKIYFCLKSGSLYSYDDSLQEVFAYPGAQKIIQLGKDSFSVVIGNTILDLYNGKIVHECHPREFIKDLLPLDDDFLIEIRSVGRNDSIFFKKEFGKDLIFFENGKKFPEQGLRINKAGTFRNLKFGLEFMYSEGYIRILDADKNVIFTEADFLEDGESSDNISSVFIDKEANIWLCYRRSLKFFKIRPKLFHNLLEDFEKGVSCRGIEGIDDDKILVSSYSGLFLIENIDNESRSFKRISELDGLKFFRDSNDILIFGRPTSELFQINKDLEISYYASDKRFQGSVKIPFRDKETGKFFIGSGKGILKKTGPDKFDFLSCQDSKFLANQLVCRVIKESPKGIIIGTTSGIYRLDPETECVSPAFPNVKTFSTVYINDIYFDANGIVWVSTESQGLFRYDEGLDSLFNFNMKNGLTSNSVYTTLEDKENHLWVPTDFGLVRLNKLSGKVISFFDSDGLPDNEFNFLSSYQTADGNIIIGGINGISYFNPSEVNALIDLKQHEVLISGIQYFDYKQGRYVSMDINGISSGTLNLKNNQKSVILKLLHLDYSSTDYVRFAFRLDGKNDNWNYVEGSEINLNNLPSGKHTLEIAAVEHGNNEIEERIFIDLEVEGPFYFQWWFLAILILGLYGLFRIYVAVKLKYLILDKKRLEEEIEKRTATIVKQNDKLERLNNTKDRFFSIIAHELKGPLLGFQKISEKISFLIKKGEFERIPVLGKKMDQSGKQINDLLDNLLVWSLAQKGDIPLKFEMVDVGKKVELILNTFEAVIENKGLKFHIDIPEKTLVFSDKNGLQLMIRNLISNAIKYSYDGGMISIKATDLNNQTVISICDQGIGMSKIEIEELFKNKDFDSTPGTDGEKGTGLGWKLILELSRRLNIGLEVNSQKNEGLSVHLILSNVVL